MLSTARVATLVAALVVLHGCVGPPTPSSEQAVRALWDEYLASKQGRYALSAGSPSPQWSAAEQKRWPVYDLATQFLQDGLIPEVLSVTPLSADADSAWRIVTRFRPAVGDASRHAVDSTGITDLTTTVFARRERRRWVLASALPYHTATWARESRGRIAYHIAPSLRFDAAKAERAAAFVDSLATALDVAAPRRIDYYVAESVDQAMEIVGAVVPQRYGPSGGFSRPGNAQVFSGIPALGENYRHELAHVLLLPIIKETPSSLLASEGVPTWLGGSGGRDFRGAVQHLSTLLREQPTIDLHRIVFDRSVPAEIVNPAGAVVAQMVFDAGGTAALIEYLQSSGSRMPETLERLLKRSWDDILLDWRARVEQIAGR